MVGIEVYPETEVELMVVSRVRFVPSTEAGMGTGVGGPCSESTLLGPNGWAGRLSFWYRVTMMPSS